LIDFDGFFSQFAADDSSTDLCAATLQVSMSIEAGSVLTSEQIASALRVALAACEFDSIQCNEPFPQFCLCVSVITIAA
jgi:hypothetical protein